jgi:hypothetical protein
MKMQRIAMFFLSVMLLITSLCIPYTQKAEAAQDFTHSGIFYSEEDFTRAKKQLSVGAEPWKLAWDRTSQTKWADPGYQPHPVAAPMRGANPAQRVGDAEMFDDAVAALTQAIIWKVSSKPAEANQAKLKAEEILDAWSSTINTPIGGGEPQLLAGLCGYKFAAAADILRGDKTWVEQGKLTAVQNMLKNYFLPPCREFLKTHFRSSNGEQYPYYYRGNQDLAAIITIMATGILSDDISIYNEAVTDLKTGEYNGRIDYYLFPTSDPNLAQSEESGRDQGHAQLGIGLLAYMAQAAYVQNHANPAIEDLFEYGNKLILRGSEYVAKHNIGGDVPFTPLYTATNNSYDKKVRIESSVSPKFRGEVKPIYDLIWNHYHHVKGLPDSNPISPVYYTREMLNISLPGRENTDCLPLSVLMYTRKADNKFASAEYCISIVPRNSTASYQFFTAADTGNAPITANKELKNYMQDATAAEKFYVEYVGDGLFTLKSGANKKYLSASRDDEPLQAKDDKIMGNQNKFYIEDVGNGYIAIKSAGTGKYLGVDQQTRQVFPNLAAVDMNSTNEKKYNLENKFRILIQIK